MTEGIKMGVTVPRKKKKWRCCSRNNAEPTTSYNRTTQSSFIMKVVAACVAAAAALDCASAFVAPVVSSGFASSSLSRSSRARAPGLRMTSAVDTDAKVRCRETEGERRVQGWWWWFS